MVLAYYSRDYPTRSACQHELTIAFLAGQREGDPRGRILVVNPEPTTDHVHPIELRDSRHSPSPVSDADLRTLAAAVASHVARIDGPLGQITPPANVRWLPFPHRHTSPRFAGRVQHLWQIHSALHHRTAPLTRHSNEHIAVVHGLTGIGKSRLVSEYAHRFQAAFPGGICWLRADPDEPLPSLHHQRTLVTQAMHDHPIRLDHAAQVFDRTISSFLWVLDGIPPGLRIDEVSELLSPHPAAFTVITSTDRRYTRLGTAIEVDPLPSADMVSLLPPSWLESSSPAVQRIIDIVDGHPEALAVLSRTRDPAAALTELHWGPAGLADLAQRITGDLARDPRIEQAAVHDLLRVIAALEPVPTTPHHLATAISRLHDLPMPVARRTVRVAIDLLDNLSLLTPRTDRMITVSPLVGHLIRTFDPDLQHQAEARTQAMNLLAATRKPARQHRPQERLSKLHRAAWAVQVELAHRVSILNSPDYGLRESIVPLYSLVDFIRRVLTDTGPEPGNRPIQEICITLLTRHLRPALTQWHPKLLNHELTRPAHNNPITHERNWIHATELRTALTTLRASLTGTLDTLSAITGSRHGLQPDALPGSG